MKRIRLVIALIILTSSALAINNSTVKAAETDDIVVTATGFIAGLPQDFTAVYINIGQVDLSWTKGTDAVNTMVRAAYNRLPDSRTDGYQVYYGDAESFSDTAMDFDEYLGKIYYAAWSENAAGVFAGQAATDFVEGVPMLLFTLAFIALSLTVAMFATKNAMLGFPSAIFWAILGAYSYTQSTTPWGDWQFYLFFASLLGMTTFCALAAYGLREKRDAIGESEMDEGGEKEGRYFDEEPEPDLSGAMGKGPQDRRQALHNRAKKRRERSSQSGRGGGPWGSMG